MKKIIIMVAILAIVFFNISKKGEYIPADSIRFRIIPNSNSVADIFIKEKVLENVYEYITGTNNTSIEEARKTLINNKEKIDSKIKKTLKTYDYDETYEINYGLNYFPKKTYNNQIYEEGYYESLVIKLGKAEGDNFWCVLFPPLCMLEIEEKKENIEYTYKIKEIIKKLFE